MLTDSDYKKLTAPESITMVGVTSRTGRGSTSPLEVLIKNGYRGQIYPVNPKGGEILGYRAYTSLSDLPEIPDIAHICAPRDAVPELFAACAAKGIKLVIITAQGFFDGDQDGVHMQHEILRIARENNIRILGPNTLGIINNYQNFCTSFLDFINPLKPIGITCQSGSFFVGAPQFCTGVGILVDSGNTTDICATDVISHMARDPRLKVINIHMESLRDGTSFMEAAKDAVALKPVIIYKTGSSEAGSLAASSHTGALSGEDRVFDAAFRQCGLLRARDVEEVLDLNKAFCTYQEMQGNRIGVVSISGGGGVIAADACTRAGLIIATPAPETIRRMSELYPKWAHCQNPMDMWPAAMFHGYQQSYRLILEALLQDSQVDAVICATGSHMQTEDDFMDVSGIIKELAGKYPHKPVAVTTFGANYSYYEKEIESDNTVLYYFSMERAARSLAALYQYHQIIKKKTIETASPSPAPSGRILPSSGTKEATGLLSCGKGNLSQEIALGLMEKYDVPTARWRRAENLAQALTYAADIGYPVTMKIICPEIIHKSEAGGVILNIENDLQLEEAYSSLMREIKLKEPAASIEGALIQEYIRGGIELLLGCKRDPTFGPILAFGAGGIYTEILDDVALGIPPLTREETREMAGRTKISKILSGARGKSAVNMELLVDCLLNLGRLAMENPEIQEIDLNPLLAFPDRVIAVDARIITN